MSDQRRKRDLDGLFGNGRQAWWRAPGASLCTAVGIGTPIDVHLFGGHLWSDAGPILGMLALFAGASFWLFRRFGDGAQPSLAVDSERLWAEFRACGCGDPACDPQKHEPAVEEPLEREPIRA